MTMCKGVDVARIVYERVSRSVDLIVNRVGIANQILGCRYSHSNGNPLRVRYSRKRRAYVLDVFGVEHIECGCCDVEGLERLFNIVDNFAGLLWLLSRGGVRFKCIQVDNPL